MVSHDMSRTTNLGHHRGIRAHLVAVLNYPPKNGIDDTVVDQYFTGCDPPLGVQKGQTAGGPGSGRRTVNLRIGKNAHVPGYQTFRSMLDRLTNYRSVNAMKLGFQGMNDFHSGHDLVFDLLTQSH